MKLYLLLISVSFSWAVGILRRSPSVKQVASSGVGSSQSISLPIITLTKLDSLKGSLALTGDGYAAVIDWLIANANGAQAAADLHTGNSSKNGIAESNYAPTGHYSSLAVVDGTVLGGSGIAVDNGKANTSKQACLFDDAIFGMNAQMKVALQKELTSGPLADAVQYVRTHPNEGWMHCGSQGQQCGCTGQVRFGEVNWLGPTWSAAFPVTGSILCDPGMFKFTLQAPGSPTVCQCAWQTEKNIQPSIQLRFNSWSYAQEAWIFLLRALAHAKWMPITGDRKFHGSQLFGSRGGGIFDRVWINKWLGTVGMDYVRNSFAGRPLKCLEWDPLFYTHKYFPSCAQSTYNLWYVPDPAKMRVEGTTIYTDILKLPQVAGALKMDLVVATQVWEHLAQPVASLKALYDAMNPGGILLFAVPFKAPFHGAPEDYWRYTKSGVVKVLEQGGFCVPRSAMASGGDFIYSIGLNAGISAGDFSQEELLASYAQGFDAIPDGPLEVFAVGVKKKVVTDACPL